MADQGGISFRDQWRAERAAEEAARLEAELNDEIDEDEVAPDGEESWERSARLYRAAIKDKGGWCTVHRRALTYPEQMQRQCNWCKHGSREGYDRYLTAHDLGRDGRPKKARAVKAIA